MSVFGGERSMSELRRKTVMEPVEAAHEIRRLQKRVAWLEEIIGDSLAALGQHPRDFSQRALIEACKVTGSDPGDWTRYPDVLERLLAASSLVGEQPATEEQKLVEEARRIADACDMDFCSLQIAAAWIRQLADALEAVLAREESARGHLRAVIAEWDGLSTKHWRASITEAKIFLAALPVETQEAATEEDAMLRAVKEIGSAIPEDSEPLTGGFIHRETRREAGVDAPDLGDPIGQEAAEQTEATDG